MDSNGLKLNDSKSEFVLLGSPQMLSKVKSETIEIRIGNNSIKPSSTVRNLGVIYDSNLSFKEELHNRFNLSLEERVNFFKHNSENLMKIG